MRYDRWTQAEDARLRKMYGAGKTDQQIAAEMCRDEKAVKARRCSMGLFRERKRGFQKRRWLVIGGRGFESKETQ